MSKGLLRRRIIYLVFIAAFLVTLPLIFLYAQGYKYDFKKGRWQKTGVIFIDCRPKGVNIFLNGKQVKERIPARIRKLLPNEYDLKISKPGYYDWEKKIKVNEGQTTLLQYVRLFKKNQQPKQIYKDNIEQVIYNQTYDIFVIQTASEKDEKMIKLVKADNGKAEEILATKEKITTLKFLENGKRILIRTPKNIWLVESGSLDKYNLVKLIGLNGVQQIKVNSRNSNYVYYIYQHALYVFNLITNKKELLFKGNILDYLVDDGQLYYLERGTLKSVFLNKINLLNRGEKSRRILVLPGRGEYRLIGASKNFISLKEVNKNELILLNKNDWQIKKIKGVAYFRWSADQNQLVYGNQSELWIFKIKAKGVYEDILVTRSSQDISNAVWLPKMTHIIYGVGNKIKATENLAWNRQVTDLFEDGKIKWVMLNKEGDKLFFSAQNNQDKVGLFKLIIQ